MIRGVVIRGLAALPAGVAAGVVAAAVAGGQTAAPPAGAAVRPYRAAEAPGVLPAPAPAAAGVRAAVAGPAARAGVVGVAAAGPVARAAAQVAGQQAAPVAATAVAAPAVPRCPPQARPPNAPAGHLRRRCRSWVRAEPPAGWDAGPGRRTAAPPRPYVPRPTRRTSPRSPTVRPRVRYGPSGARRAAGARRGPAVRGGGEEATACRTASGGVAAGAPPFLSLWRPGHGAAYATSSCAESLATGDAAAISCGP